MNRNLLAGAVFLALTSLAVAQTPPENTPPPLPQTEAPEAVVTPPAEKSDEAAAPERPGDVAKMRGGRDRDMKRAHGVGMGHGEMGRHGYRHGSGHHYRREASGNGGAQFTFEGPGRGKVQIRCAAGESTQDCVDAVLPMLRNLMQEFHGARNRS